MILAGKIQKVNTPKCDDTSCARLDMKGNGMRWACTCQAWHGGCWQSLIFKKCSLCSQWNAKRPPLPKSPFRHPVASQWKPVKRHAAGIFHQPNETGVVRPPVVVGEPNEMGVVRPLVVVGEHRNRNSPSPSHQRFLNPRQPPHPSHHQWFFDPRQPSQGLQTLRRPASRRGPSRRRMQRWARPSHQAS